MSSVVISAIGYFQKNAFCIQKINAQYQGADRVKALLGLSGIFADDLPQNADFVNAVPFTLELQLATTAIAPIADRVIRMHDGRVTAVETNEQLTAPVNLKLYH